MKKLSCEPRYKLNAVCPYFTMFPLEFPLNILKKTNNDIVVFDPFCGRGTTNYAAQTLGIRSYGLDSSPIAVAIAKAKLAITTQEKVLKLANLLLEKDLNTEVPQGEFWEWAFHHKTLIDLCKLREGLRTKKSDTAIMLRAVILGCLHGPLTKDSKYPSYFSNQMPRTFAPKPKYSVRYWKEHKLIPRFVDVYIPIRKKTSMVLQHEIETDSYSNNIRCADSRNYKSYNHLNEKIDLVISSPPYYGMRTYVQDQWLRNWFLGGPDFVDYDTSKQVTHLSPYSFSSSLSEVWDNIHNIASNDIRMVIRFGGIASKKADYDTIFRNSLEQSEGDWHIYYSRNAGSSYRGRRQADAMGERAKSSPTDEKDYFIRLRT